MNEFFKIDERLLNISEKALEKCAPEFEKIANNTRYNQQKVLKSFIKNEVSESHFAPSTGYGYGDRGRETLDRVFADCMGADSALIRHSFASGTHTLSVMLFGILRPGDELVSITGRPYDTLIGVLGIDGYSDGSLADFGIKYRGVELREDGTPDTEEIKRVIEERRPKVAYIQRSKGYSLRPSLSCEEIKRLSETVKKISPETVVMLDNCYGEFVERMGINDMGVDIAAGSLIKNPGGGIAPSGGYICGKAPLVEKCSYRMTAAGVGAEIGASLGHTRELFMGLFNAPHATGEALKTAVYAAALFEELGFGALPKFDAPRTDIIQTLLLETPEALTAFCQGMQSGAPIDSFVVPEAWDMPGYDDQVIMAAGAFTGGSSIELSADAPLRPPFAVWMQGGLNFDSAQIGVLLAAQKMIDKGIIKF